MLHPSRLTRPPQNSSTGKKFAQTGLLKTTYKSQQQRLELSWLFLYISLPTQKTLIKPAFLILRR